MTLKNLYSFEKWENVNGLWVKKAVTRAMNIVPTQGLNEIQKEFWTGNVYVASFFVGIIPAAGFTTVALTDTAAQINGTNGWTEFVGYSEAVRQILSMGSPMSGAIDNSASQAVFTVTANFTLQGGFVATVNGKGSTGGLLIGATSAPSPIPYTIGQQVRITVSSTLSN